MSDREDPRLEAAQRRLRESTSRTDTLEAVREIVTNLLGCEEIALFRIESDNHGLFWSFGIDPEKHKTLDALKESAVHRVLQGEPHIARGPHEAHPDQPKLPLRVLAPICKNGRTVAVLAMLRFLPQKIDFDQRDLKLVRLLCDEIGPALFAVSAKANA